MSRRIGISVLLLALALGGPIACSAGNETTGTAQADRPTIRVATLVWVGYAPIHLAHEKGFFAERGVDVRLQKIEDTAARRAALSSGSVDASVDIVDSFANAAAAGLPAKVVLKLDDSMGGDGIVVGQDIQEVADLRGRTVAYPPGQPSHFFLLSLLEDVGLTVDDVRSRPMEADQAGAAFVSGRVDAAVTWEPWLTKAADLPHGKVLVTSRDTPGLIVDILTVRSDYLEQNPEAVKSFILGWFDAVDYWREHPEEANRIMAGALGLEPEVFADMVQGVRYSDREINRSFFDHGDDGSEFTRLFDHASHIWQEAGVLQTPTDATTVDGSALVLEVVGNSESP